MQFLTSLLEDTSGGMLVAAIAVGIALSLAVLGVWAARQAMQPSAQPLRGRARRLTIVDQVQIDKKRQMIIVRRDGVEHLILTGGPQDLVVETGILAEPPQAAMRRPAEQQPAPQFTRPDVERLRPFIRPTTSRKPPPLRNTGLLRAVPSGEAAVIPLPQKPDSTPVADAIAAKAGGTEGTH